MRSWISLERVLPVGEVGVVGALVVDDVALGLDFGDGCAVKGEVAVRYRHTEQQGEGILPSPLTSLESGPRTSARLFLWFWGSNLRLGFSRLRVFLRVERGESGEFSTNLWKGQMVRL